MDLYESAPCGLALLDVDGVVVRANHELLRLVGLPAEQVVGTRTLSSLLTVGGRIMVETHLVPAVERSGAAREVALDLLRPDGERVPVILNATSAAAVPGGTDGTNGTNGTDGTGGTGVAQGAAGAAGPVVVAVFESRQRHRYEDDLLRAKAAAETALVRATALAETLQQTLIPPQPPVIAHLELAAAYRPAGDGTEVGGDFYDVFQVGPEQWVVVLGDVSGKGAAAAIVASFVQYTVRALAAVQRDPATILGLLDTALHGHVTDRYCTVVVALLERTDHEWAVAISLGGHPPALLRSPDGSVRELGRPGTPVGLIPESSFHTVRHRLGEEILTLYTDGVSEARSEDGMFGEARLTSLIRGLPHEPAVVTETVVQAALTWQSGRTSDDIAVVSIATR